MGLCLYSYHHVHESSTRLLQHQWQCMYTIKKEVVGYMLHCTWCVFNGGGTRKRLPKFPIPVTYEFRWSLMSTRSAEHAFILCIKLKYKKNFRKWKLISRYNQSFKKSKFNGFLRFLQTDIAHYWYWRLYKMTTPQVLWKGITLQLPGFFFWSQWRAHKTE